MNTTFKRLLLVCALALTAFAVSDAYAERLPRGIYLLKCDGNGNVRVYNVIGNYVGTVVNATCVGTWVRKIVVRECVAAPDPPTYTPLADPIWQQMSALQWVHTIRDNFLPSPGEPLPAAEVEEIQQATLPELTCNEAHFDPPMN